MAADNPCIQKHWQDWRRKMRESRRKRCKEWTSRLTKSDWEEEEGEDISKQEEDLKAAKDQHEEGGNESKEWEEITERTDEEDDLEKRLHEEENEDHNESNKRKSKDENNLIEDDEVSDREEKAEENQKDEKYLGKDVKRKLEKNKVDKEETGEEEVYVWEVGNEEHQRPKQKERFHLREDRGGIQGENLQQSKYSSVESKFQNQYVQKQHEDSDEQEDPIWRNDSGILHSLSVGYESENNGYNLSTGDETTVLKSRATREEFHKNLQEEESSDDEEAQCSTFDCNNDGDEEVKTFCGDDIPARMFLTLREFRDSSLLTDLTLKTEDGRSLCVHSLVLAAISSLIRKNLSRSKERNYRDNERGDISRRAGVHSWSLCLGPEVDHVGLEGIVEFAYTGLISCLNEHVGQIRAAAEALGAQRVLDLCANKEEQPTKTGGCSEDIQIMISFQSIKQLWMNRVGCDVILEACGGSLHAHRVILAVSSDYFRGMFTLGMKESFQSSVYFPFLPASELDVLIDSSYSGSLPLSWMCIFEITGAALQLQYQPALSLCLNFLQQEITPHTCLDVVSFAEAYEIAHLLDAADDFVLRQFQMVARTSKFNDLPAKQLLKYLNSSSLCVPSELVVFKAVVSWIQAKPSRRHKLAKELMKTVHFSLMTFKEFKEVQSEDMWRDHRLAGLYKAVLEEFCSTQTAMRNECRIYLPKESLVIIGGDQISEDLGGRSISRELWFGNSLRSFTGIQKSMEWRSLGEMPEPARFNHEVAVLNGQLYVLGGKKYYGSGDTLNSTYRYDPLQDNWESLSEMQEKRCSFSVVVLNGKLYAVGGHCEINHLDSVELYCPSTNSWSFTRPLDLPLSGHVAKVLKGQIFISGGRNSDFLCLSSMFLYHPERGSTFLTNMNNPRAHHCMEALGDCLYVAGGITTDDNVTVVDQLACEVYCPAADTWTTFTPLLVPHVGAGSAVLEGKFYLLGGYSQEDCSDTNMVHRYDTTTEKWENIGKMPGPNNDLQACILCLPQHLRT